MVADALPFGLVLFEPDWHQGIVGLVASRLKEMLNRPVIACAPARRRSSDERVKGSGRSIAGFHLRDVLADVDAANPGLLAPLRRPCDGGRAEPAARRIERIRGRVRSGRAQTHCCPNNSMRCCLTDGELDARRFHARSRPASLRSAGPWGQAFPEPLFDGEFEVVSGMRSARRICA